MHNWQLTSTEQLEDLVLLLREQGETRTEFYKSANAEYIRRTKHHPVELYP